MKSLPPSGGFHTKKYVSDIIGLNYHNLCFVSVNNHTHHQVESLENYYNIIEIKDTPHQ